MCCGTESTVSLADNDSFVPVGVSRMGSRDRGTSVLCKVTTVSRCLHGGQQNV